jgi:nucleotide-binding universal stress UspA family protein
MVTVSVTHTLSRILVPTDFSSASDEALEYGKMLAARVGASLHVLHVIEEPEIAGAWGSEIYVAELPRIREAAQRAAEERLNQIFTQTKGEDLQLSTEIADGHVARTIVEIARRRRIDLIVMGTHGRSGVAHWLLGSVTEKALRTAPCPVLAVRAIDHAADRASNE